MVRSRARPGFTQRSMALCAGRISVKDHAQNLWHSTVSPGIELIRT
jgi:hypothetical protein